MNALVAIWDFSLSLCAVALAAMAVLLAGRVISGNRQDRRIRERRRLMPLLLTGGADATMRPIARLESLEAMRLTTELAELVRGQDRDAFLANATILGVPETLHRQARSWTAQDRLLAAEALALFPGEAGRVQAMLRDRNPDVRLGAALALAQNNAAPPSAQLVRDLGLGTTERSRLVVALLRDLVEYDAAGVEAMIYEESLPDAAKLAAVDALAASGRVEHAPLVSWMAEAAAQDTALQPRIYRALGRIGHPGGHAAIRKGLDSDWWQTRTAAAEAAGRTAFTGAAERLGELLDDPQWWVRLRAGQALSALREPGRAVLERIAESGNELARDAARAILAESSAR